MNEATMTSDLSRAVAEVNTYLPKAVATFDLPDNLAEAVRYTLLSGGKRLRPALVLLCCDAVNSKRHEFALPPAAAIEMIHCFSLIHDDLPAMDDDDLRRGQPTSHVKFGPALAILAGDTLATLPYAVLARGPATAGRGSDTRSISAMVRELVEATAAMIAGQVYDTIGGLPANLTPIEELQLIHRHKTGALIRCACRLGALAANAHDEQQMQALTGFGERIGLMFQIVDDLLDVTQTTQALGKRAGKDETAGKTTFPGVLGLDESQERVRHLAHDAKACLKPLGPTATPLTNLVDYLASRTA